MFNILSSHSRVSASSFTPSKMDGEPKKHTCEGERGIAVAIVERERCKIQKVFNLFLVHYSDERFEPNVEGQWGKTATNTLYEQDCNKGKERCRYVISLEASQWFVGVKCLLSKDKMRWYNTWTAAYAKGSSDSRVNLQGW